MNANRQSTERAGTTPPAAVRPCGLLLLDGDLRICQSDNLEHITCVATREDPRGMLFDDAFPLARASRLSRLIDETRRGNAGPVMAWFETPAPIPCRDETFEDPCRRSRQGVALFRLNNGAHAGHIGVLVFRQEVTPVPCANTACATRELPSADDGGLRLELEKSRQRLMQSEKMAAVGQLAAGVAHEINNPVGYVISNMQVLSGYLRDLLRVTDSVENADNITTVHKLQQSIDYAYLRKDINALIGESQEGLDRISRIVAALKDFSHFEEREQFHPANLHQIIDTTLKVVGSEMRYKAEIVLEYGDIPAVECIASQIKQVLANLLVNAAHAMCEYGRITVRTGGNSSSIWFEVEDTGTGMEPAVANRIFEPFFTTKPVGKGTGLGLALSHNIVEKHSGRIEVFTTPGEGSRFRVWLPINHVSARAAPEDNLRELDGGEIR